MSSAALSELLRIRKTGWRVLLGLASVWACGCASTPPIDAWQQRVEGIVLDEGSLNLDKVRLLGELGLPTRLRPALIIVGDGDPGRHSTLFGATKREARGALVDVFPYGSRDWLVFLLGVVRRHSTWRYHPEGTTTIEDIRPVGLALSGTEPIWEVGPPDPEAVKRYLSADSGAWWDEGKRHLYGFPRRVDAFEVVEAPGGVNVCETRTGACWALNLPADPTPDAGQFARVE